MNGADPLNDADGYNLPSGPGIGKTIEGATPAEIAAAGVVPVSKTLVQKILPLTGKPDINQLYLFRVAEPLY